MRPGAAADAHQDAKLVLNVPETALIPEGASFYEGDDDGRCRVIRPSGERCGASRMRAYGLCPGHAGIGGVAASPRTASKLGHAEKMRRRERRMLLGITARRASSPVQMARMRAQERAEALAEAIIDGPLDDAELGSVARQRAAIGAVELLYPQVTASLDVALPDEADGVGEMGWQEMQQLAAQLLGDGD